MRSLPFIIFIFMPIVPVFAVKAVPAPVRVTEPDGRVLELVIRGDEFFRYMVASDGRTVVQGDDGYYYYASYTLSGVEVSDRRVVPGPASFYGERTMAVGVEAASAMRGRRLSMLSSSGMLPAGPASGRFAPGMPVRVIVIPVQFSDVRFSVDNPSAHFDAMLNSPSYSANGATGSAYDYFKANIPQLDFVFDVAPVVSLSRPMAYYGMNDKSIPQVIDYDVNLQKLVREACLKADPDVDFSEYDNDGDGLVDYVFFYFAGLNEAESGRENTIWPQTAVFGGDVFELDGKVFSMFGCSSELSGFEGNVPAGIGTFCHEFSHFLGLKDLYDVDYSVSGTANCLWGTLSLMDEGNYNNAGRTPPYFCAVDRELSGAISYLEPVLSPSYVLQPSFLASEVMRVDTDIPGEYFLIENRIDIGWDAYIGGRGLVVYHIDKSSAIVEGIRASVRWDVGLINTCAAHECADLVEAYRDAVDQSQVFFPGQGHVTEFSATSIPSFTDWQGNPMGFRIYGISYADNGCVTFGIEEDYTEKLLYPVSYNLDVYQREAYLKWECERSGVFDWGIMLENIERDSTVLSDTVSFMEYGFSSLEPKTDYRLGLYYIGEDANGDTLYADFTTMPLTSPYPYIFGIRNSYPVGSTVFPKVLNLGKDCVSLEWSLNGRPCDEGAVVLDVQGKNRIEARIGYSDGSFENITKYMDVGQPLEDPL